MKKSYAEISKSEAQDDGTLKVWGYASTGAVDADGEIITPDAMKAALPDYMKFGAVREMHDAKKAAGTAIEASIDAEGRTYFGAHIVDAEAVKKVQAGVYKGFSIGGKITGRDELVKTTITGIKLIEVSLVDRPANPEAVITIMKAERTDEDDVAELADMLDARTVSPAEVLALIKASKVTPGTATETVAKGMGHVAQLALLLKAILTLVQDQRAEAVREGDASTVPASLQDWLNAGGCVLAEMVTEETAEMDQGDTDGQTGYDAPYLYLADKALSLVKTDDIAKAGAALSAKNKKHIQSIHDAAACLGACPADASKAAHADDLAKAATDQRALVEAEHVEALAKVQAEHADALAKANDAAAVLAKRVTQLEAMPAPGKALLKAIGKGDDLGTPVAAAPLVKPVFKGDGSVDDAATLIKQLHASRVAV